MEVNLELGNRQFDGPFGRRADRVCGELDPSDRTEIADDLRCGRRDA